MGDREGSGMQGLPVKSLGHQVRGKSMGLGTRLGFKCCLCVCGQLSPGAPTTATHPAPFPLAPVDCSFSLLNLSFPAPSALLDEKVIDRCGLLTYLFCGLRNPV